MTIKSTEGPATTSAIIEDYKRLLADTARSQAVRDEEIKALRAQVATYAQRTQTLEHQISVGPKAQALVERMGYTVVETLDEKLTSAKTSKDILKALNEANDASVENLMKSLKIEGKTPKQYHITRKTVVLSALGAALGLGGVMWGTAAWARKRGHEAGVKEVVEQEFEVAVHKFENGAGVDMRTQHEGYSVHRTVAVYPSNENSMHQLGSEADAMQQSEFKAA